MSVCGLASFVSYLEAGVAVVFIGERIEGKVVGPLLRPALNHFLPVLHQDAVQRVLQSSPHLLLRHVHLLQAFVRPMTHNLDCIVFVNP